MWHAIVKTFTIDIKLTNKLNRFIICPRAFMVMAGHNSSALDILAFIENCKCFTQAFSPWSKCYYQVWLIFLELRAILKMHLTSLRNLIISFLSHPLHLQYHKESVRRLTNHIYSRSEFNFKSI